MFILLYIVTLHIRNTLHFKNICNSVKLNNISYNSVKLKIYLIIFLLCPLKNRIFYKKLSKREVKFL